MRILAFAYACEPGHGSEAGAGWTWARMAARVGETWVITREANRAAIEEALPSTPECDRLHFVYVELPGWARRWKRGQRGVRLYYMLWQAAAVLRARSLVRERGFDLYWHLTFANVWLGAGAALLRKPFIYGPIGGGVGVPWPFLSSLGVRGAASELARGLVRGLGRYVNPLAHLSVRRADLILANNRETQEWLPRSARSRSIVFHNTVIDDEFLARARVASAAGCDGKRETSVALFAARLVPGKGAHLAIEAVAHSEGWELVICGTGPDEERLRRLAAGLRVADRVDFIGWQPRTRVAELLVEADAFIQPSVIDDGSFSVAEARAVGIPILCVDWGGPPAVAGPAAHLASARSRAAAVADLASALRVLRRQAPERQFDSHSTLDETFARLRRLLEERGLIEVEAGAIA